ncbi:MAG: hypothetical protein JWP87_5983 [Labilithrix sp.]|nr:hypothetical protein [Labilithrix sp.]
MRFAGIAPRAALVCAIAALLGCPPDDKRSPAKPPSGACEKVGQSCEFSPGKLGTCVQQDDCKTGSCFVCQSQH